MTFGEWVDSERQGRPRKTVLEAIAAETGVSFATLSDAARGLRVGRYETAKKIETATGGRVTIKELCEGQTK